MSIPQDDVQQDAATIAARGGWSGEFATRPSSPPLYLTTAFDLQGLGQLEAVAAGREPGYFYMRDGHPNHAAFAADVAALEGAAEGAVMSSGMGGFAALALSLVRSGDHVIAADALYGRTSQLLNWLSAQFGVQVSYFPAANPGAVRSLLRPETRFCLVESISNPLVEVTDLAAIAQELGDVPLVVDNTFASPCLLRPIEHGAKLVWHSGSKYLNGHGDAMVGVVVGDADIIRRVRATTALVGLNANPFECWLASRGLRTLPLRMQRVSTTALELATWLEHQPGVGRVYYPGLSTHPTRGLADRYLRGTFGGMLAIDLQGGRQAIDLVMQRLSERIPFSPTLADARTTLSHPASTSHKFLTAQARAELGIGDGVLRISVGLEAPTDLIAEFTSALAGM